MENLKKYIDAIENTDCGKMIEGDTSGDFITLSYAVYSPIVHEMIEDFFASDLVDYNYNETAPELLDNFEAMIHTMTVKQVGSCLTYIFRVDRFCEGLILANLENGRIAALLKRLLELA